MTYQEKMEEMAAEINFPYVFHMYNSSMMMHILLNSIISGKKHNLSAEAAFDELLKYIFENTELKEN